MGGTTGIGAEAALRFAAEGCKIAVCSHNPEKVEAIGAGGMSGAPLFSKSLKMVKYIHGKTGDNLPIIGVGGIMSPQQAAEMLDAGASLVEIYSGFIYEGPAIIRRILKYLQKRTCTEN